MLNPILPRDLGERPWLPFFRRAEGLASAAFETIPVVGPAVARLFEDVVVPVCTPPRDAALRRLWRVRHALEDAVALLILRLFPLPPPLPPPLRGGGSPRS